MKKSLVSILLTCSLVVSLAACGSSSSESTETEETTESKDTAEEAEAEEGTAAESGELTEMTLAFTTWVGSGPFYIAKEQGFFAENGLDVDISIIDDESTYASLLANNSVQALGHVLDREVINYSKGVEETVVMPYDQSSGGDGIVVSEEIQSPEDLAGKTIALNKSSTSYFYFLTVLTEAGLTEDDVTIKDMDADSAGTSFVQSQVDAAVTWEPWLSNADQREGGHLLCDSADYPNTIVDVVAMTDVFIEENPDAPAAFIKAWNEAIEWYYDGNEEEGNQIMADGLGIDLEDFESQLPGVTWYYDETLTAFCDEGTEDNIYDVGNRAISFWVERELIEESFDSTELITGAYVQ